MNIQEFQAKQLLKSCGINVPRGGVASTPEQAEEIGSQLGGSKWMVKAQVPAGGRSEGSFKKSGSSGIRTAADLSEIRRLTGEMLGNVLVTKQTDSDGLEVKRVYIEQALNVEREMALSLLIDQKNSGLSLLFSKIGGVQIESLVSRMPESIYFIPVSLKDGIDTVKLEQTLDQLDLFETSKTQLRELISNVFRLFREKDASLVEINPLAIVDDELFALDAKITFDNNAFFRQEEIRAIESETGRQDHNRQASLDGFNYIPLDGNVGCLAVGAGLSMAVLDAIKYSSGHPANFLDIPPGSKVNRVRSALELLLSKPGIKSILINVFGGGIMRCDTVADAMLLVNKSNPISVPLVVRLAGTNADLANRRLKESMPNVLFASNLAEAANLAVNAAGQYTVRSKKSAGESWFSQLSVFRKSS